MLNLENKKEATFVAPKKEKRLLKHLMFDYILNNYACLVKFNFFTCNVNKIHLLCCYRYNTTRNGEEMTLLSYEIFSQIIEQGRLLADENQLWEKNLKLYFSLIDIIGVGRLGENISKETKQYFGERYKSWLSLYPFSYLRKEINRKDVNSQQFKLWFNNEYSVEGISKAGSYMSLSDYFYAISLNIIVPKHK